VGNGSGIFFLGRPTTLMAFDDGIVLLPASTLGALLGGQGVAGAAVKLAHDRKQTKDRAAAADDLSATDFAGQKRARVIPYADISSAQIQPGRMQHKLIFETGDGSRFVRYAKKLWPEADAAAFFSERLQDKFTSAAAK
jgi:hypothetical protein